MMNIYELHKFAADLFENRERPESPPKIFETHVNLIVNGQVSEDEAICLQTIEQAIPKGESLNERIKLAIIAANHDSPAVRGNSAFSIARILLNPQSSDLSQIIGAARALLKDGEVDVRLKAEYNFGKLLPTSPES